MSKRLNRQIVLASRPEGTPVESNFSLEESSIPSPSEGQVLLKLHYLSLDPYMRGRMSAAKSYAEPTKIGSIMEGATVGEVIESRSADFKTGDMVLSYSGWQEFATAQDTSLRKLDPTIAPLTTALGILGMPGFTAYSGLLTIGKPMKGETLVVAAATGPVGSAVGQIAKIKGARVVGIAGGAKKCRALLDEFGFDSAIDHHEADFVQKLAAACPQGIDIYFENVGGKVFQAVLPLLNKFARIPVCGLIAHYNHDTSSESTGYVPLFMRDILTKSLTVRGFIQSDFSSQRSDFHRDMEEWVSKGKIHYREDIIGGLENAPKAFISLLEGGNFGKLIVKVG
nr:NADP-dependent oxidoreductase [Xenorhabdus sp. PB30.3]